jgi:hypothetical protein
MCRSDGNPQTSNHSSHFNFYRRMSPLILFLAQGSQDVLRGGRHIRQKVEVELMQLS